VLAALGRREEAHAAYQRALTLATTVAPDFQSHWIPTLEGKLATR
jgi:predicted RNA polymerase sigma factor